MSDLLRSVTLTDVVDILFVAVLLYTAIAWVKTTRAAFVVRGILVLAGIYLIARQLELQLTAWIFQGFFAILLIIIVVIFQEELRQIFERIAVWSLRARGAPLERETAHVLVRTVADLAKDRIGALIVIRGKDPLERHLMGGVALGGSLSEPLLKSIFDPHSPGHDGAVIIEEGRVSRFAAHLPLSKDLEQLSGLGTRHSAGLALAELTDALCIVVSEERGTISVAHEGRLRKIDQVQELVALLEEFLQEKYPSEERKWLRVQFLRENWIAKGVALSLAAAFWYVFVPGSKIVEATYRVPVEVENLSPDLQLEGIQPQEVEVTFSGPRRAFYLFDSSKLKVTVDVSLAEMGRRTFRISERNVIHPNELQLLDVSPSTLRISVRKLPRKEEAQKG